MLCRAGFDLEGLQLLLGLEHPEGALDDDGRAPQSPKAPACHPAPHVLLEDGGLMLHEDLVGDKQTPAGFTRQEEQRLLHGPEEGRAKASLGFRR